MTQYARPASDITVGSWTDEGTVDNDGNLYTSLDEVTRDDDSSYIQGTNGAGSSEVKLSTVTDPVSSTGHILHVWFRSIGSGAGEKMDFYLYCATTLIVQSINQTNRSDTYADIAVTLTTDEADAITDYSDLRIRMDEDTIGTGEYVRITQCYIEVPDAPGTTWYGIAALAGVGACDGIAEVINNGIASLSGVGNCAGIAEVINNGIASLSGVGSVTAEAEVTNYALASLSGVGTLTAQL